MKKINLFLLLAAFSTVMGTFSYAGKGNDSDSESTHGSDSGSENGMKKVRKPVIVVGKPKKIESVPGDDFIDILEDTRNQASIGYKKEMQQEALTRAKTLAALDKMDSAMEKKNPSKVEIMSGKKIEQPLGDISSILDETKEYFKKHPLNQEELKKFEAMVGSFVKPQKIGRQYNSMVPAGRVTSSNPFVKITR